MHGRSSRVSCSLPFSWAYLSRRCRPKSRLDYVDPFIGAGSTTPTKEEAARLHFDPNFEGFHGKLFPGACTPAGMIQLSPDTITGGDNGAGYSYPHTTIQGFSFMHLSGVGAYGDFGNLLVMPTCGPLMTYYGDTGKPGTGYLSSYSKGSEIAQAGYYAVTLDDYKVRAETTAAPHSGILRFTFGKNPASRIQIDLARRIGGTSLHQTVKVTDDHSIEGVIDCPREGGGWMHGKVAYTVYYHAEFSKPLKNVGVWSATLPPGPYTNIIAKPEFAAACRAAEILPGCREKEGQHLGFYAEFPTGEGEAILVKAGLSFVSLEGARANLATEIPAWDFDGVRQQARESWARELNRMSVDGGTEDQKTIFYTALYHALIDPRTVADVNGDYVGGDGKVHRATGFTKRTVFSGWDVYRSQYPLMTIVAPNVVNDQINSEIELAEQNGTHYFDRWELMNAYTGCMCGNPEVAVINDAYQKGIRNFDIAKAYETSATTCERLGKRSARVLDGRSRCCRHAGERLRGLEPRPPGSFLEPRGREEIHGPRPGLPACFQSRHALDLRQERERCATRMEGLVPRQGWKRQLGPLGGADLRAGRDRIRPVSGGLVRPAGCSRAYFPDGWKGSIRREAQRLLRAYAQAETNGTPMTTRRMSRATSSPSCSTAPARPYLTQKWIRRLVTETYGAKPNGLCGDDDEGQMSAWFILAASGLHQACPGDPRFEIFTPLFRQGDAEARPEVCAGIHLHYHREK